MKPRGFYMPTLNSVLNNFVIALAKDLENYHNLKQLRIYPSIQKLFAFDFPIQIACDFKIAALLVEIHQASSNFPCPFVRGVFVLYLPVYLNNRGSMNKG